MAASVPSSPQAVEMSIYVVRAFVRLREALAGNRELACRMAELEQRLTCKLADHEQAITQLPAAIRQLMHPSEPRNAPSDS